MGDLASAAGKPREAVADAQARIARAVARAGVLVASRALGRAVVPRIPCISHTHLSRHHSPGVRTSGIGITSQWNSNQHEWHSTIHMKHTLMSFLDSLNQ